jgi:hypothetical protein
MLGILVLSPSWVHDTAEKSVQHVRNWSTRLWLLQSSAEVPEVVQAKETGQVSRVTPVVAEVGDDPTAVVEVALVTY